jgi:hypothetical protein
MYSTAKFTSNGTCGMVPQRPRGKGESMNDRIDSSWRGMYGLGGICLILAGAAILAVAVLSILLGPPPSGGEEYLKALSGHALLARFNFGLFALADLLLLLGVLALYLSLNRVAKNSMLAGTAFLALFVVLDLAITELNSLTLVTLTQHYRAAASDAQRAEYVAAADYALATLPIGTFLSYFVSSVGLLIVSIVMLKGLVSKAAAYAGIVASAAGILGGFYPVLPVLGVLLTPSLVAFGVWSVLAGAGLCRLRRQSAGG